MLEPLLQAIHAYVMADRGRRWLAIGGGIGATLALLAFLNPIAGLQPHPDNLTRLRDPSYQLPDELQAQVGNAGYDSLYDYVRQEISASTVYVAGLHPFYLYDADYTTHFTYGALYPLGAADAVTPPAWEDIAYVVLSEGSYQSDPARWTQQRGWQLLYRDAIGRVFARQSAGWVA